MRDPLRVLCAAIACALPMLAAASDAVPDARVSTWIGGAVRDETGRAIGRVTGVWLDLAGRQPAMVTVVPAAGGATLMCHLGRGGLEVSGRSFITVSSPPERAAPCAAAGKDGRAVAPFDSTKTLLGAPIKSSDGDDVGAVKDVVVHASTGRVHYLLAQFSPMWVQKGELTILPTRPLRHERDNVFMTADIMELQRLPMVQEDRVEDVSAPSFASAVDGYLVTASAPAK